MTATLFPTIDSAVCARYVAEGRRATNAVSAQIRARVSLQRGTPPCERAENQHGVLGNETAPRRPAASLLSSSPASLAGEKERPATAMVYRNAEAGDDGQLDLARDMPHEAYPGGNAIGGVRDHLSRGGVTVAAECALGVAQSYVSPRETF